MNYEEILKSFSEKIKEMYKEGMQEINDFFNVQNASLKGFDGFLEVMGKDDFLSNQDEAMNILLDFYKFVHQKDEEFKSTFNFYFNDNNLFDDIHELIEDATIELYGFSEEDDNNGIIFDLLYGYAQNNLKQDFKVDIEDEEEQKEFVINLLKSNLLKIDFDDEVLNKNLIPCLETTSTGGFTDVTFSITFEREEIDGIKLIKFRLPFVEKVKQVSFDDFLNENAFIYHKEIVGQDYKGPITMVSLDEYSLQLSLENKRMLINKYKKDIINHIKSLISNHEYNDFIDRYYLRLFLSCFLKK